MLAGEGELNPYLQQEVNSASPVRLRWMLIQRAEELCGMVSQMWAKQQYTLAEQWLLRIREIFGELLDGVKDQSNPVSETISDFYVFLLKLAIEAEQTRQPERLHELRSLLAIEVETWRLVLDKVGSETASAHTLGSGSHLVFPQSSELSASGSFSLEV